MEKYMKTCNQWMTKITKEGRLILSLLVILSAGILNSETALAQQEVQGTVVDAQSGETLPGVNIRVQGNDSRGTVSDIDGNFSITLQPEENVLIFSYVGYTTQEVNVEGQQELTIQLEPSIGELEELVVIGYGVQQQQDLTGSIRRVSTDDIVKQPSLTATEALQGKVAGVNVIQNDAPGGTPTVIMRGLGTALGGRSPLYIVDGVPVDNINNISPSDIENIDFLKDAAAASIYGLRAANGVIIVTTKDGESGAPKFNIESYAGYTSVLNEVDMAGTQEYINYFNEENAAIGAFQLNQNQPYETDWYDELIEPGYVLNTTASVSGGSDNVNYFVSYNLNNEKGLLDDQKFWRQTLRNNNEYRLFDDFLTFNQNLSVSVTNENPMPFGAFNTAYRQSPLVPTYYPNGRYGQAFVNETTGVVSYEAAGDESIGRLNTHGNPLTAVNFNNEERRTVTLQGNVAANMNFTESLTFTSRIGGTRYYQDEENFSPLRAQWLAGDPTRTVEQYQQSKEANPGVTDWANNTLLITNQQTFRWNWDNFLNYVQSFDQHNFDVTLGMSSEKFGIGQRFEGRAYDVPGQEQYWNLDLATDEYDKIIEHTNYTPTTLLSYFGRVQYNFDRRYYISATLRRDGSSRFANNEEYWDLFPSVGLGWTISNEDFMAESAVNFLKLRASWGRLGNQNVPFNTTVINTNTGSGSQNYVFGPNQALFFGASVGAPAQDISWENVEEWNFGGDIEFFEGRFSGAVDVYQKTTENVILVINPLLDSPFEGTYYDHGGEVVNQGIELSANWMDNITEDFSYNVGVSFSYNENEVTNVNSGYEGQTGGSLSNGQITKRLEEGQPLGAWWMYDAIGVWQNEEQIANNASIGGALPGHLRYDDVNDDGVIDDRDKKFFGSYIPKYNYGINVGLNYKQIDFSVDAFGAGGNKVYNGINSARFGGENISQEVYDNRWTGENSTNEHPGANRDAVASDYYLEDGSFLRINNITLGYSLPNIVDRVSNLRFYVSAQNPFMFTGYSGFTPELIGNDNGDPYERAGIELNAYPNTRMLLFGINVEFQ